MNKRLRLFIILLILIFGIFFVFYFRASDYEVTYVINDINVKEIYNKEKAYYQFIFTYNDKSYSLISFDKYTNKRNLIDEIEVTESDDTTCLGIKSKVISTYKLCSNSNLVADNYKDNPEFNTFENYQDYNINNLDNKTYLMWQYDGFNYINNSKKEKIKLFDKEIYNVNLVYTFDNYLLIPDYNKEYQYNKMNVIDVSTGKVKSIDLRYDIYFDSYFLGNDKKIVYLYDKKEKQEYYINLDNEKIYKSNNKILVNGAWEEVSSYKLQEEKAKFYNTLVYNYEVIDSKLYSFINDHEYSTLITDKIVKEIVKIEGFNVYFISEDTLYKYNPYEGIKPLIKYNEWNYNYKNMVYIFD